MINETIPIVVSAVTEQKSIWLEALPSLIGVVIGGVISLATTAFFHNNTEKKNNRKEVYAPIFYEMEDNYNRLSYFPDSFSTKEYELVKQQRYVLKPKLRHKIERFYAPDAPHFLRELNILRRSIYDFLFSELKPHIKKKDSDHSKYAWILMEECIYPETTKYYARLLSGFEQFKKEEEIDYDSAKKMISELKTLVQAKDDVKIIIEMHKKLRNNAHHIITELSKELGLRYITPEVI